MEPYRWQVESCRTPPTRLQSAKTHRIEMVGGTTLAKFGLSDWPNSKFISDDEEIGLERRKTVAAISNQREQMEYDRIKEIF